MGKERKLGQMELCMKEIIFMVKKKDTEPSNGQMGQPTRVNL